jgi:hypothetical protein
MVRNNGRYEDDLLTIQVTMGIGYKSKIVFQNRD